MRDGKSMTLDRKQKSIIGKLFNRRKTTAEQEYYVHGSGLIPIPIGRLNEVPKVIQEFHELEVVKMRLAGIARH
jgi:hypothetical protein